MLQLVSDFELFSKIWRKFERYARGEGLKDSLLLKALSGTVTSEEGTKFGSCLNHWLANHATDEDQKIYVEIFSKAVAALAKEVIDTAQEEKQGMVDFEIT